MGKSLELTNPAHKRGIHTAYVGDNRDGCDGAGNAKRITAQNFVVGKTGECSVRTHELLRGAGVVRK